MCKIREVLRVEKMWVVICTFCEGDFMKAKAVIVFDERGEPCRVTKFHMDHTRQCFNNNPISPVFGTEEALDERFLRIGNKIEFELEAP